MNGFVKLLSVLVIIALTSVKGFFQTEAEVAMQSGNSLYQNNDYDNAIGAYEEVLSLGYESSALYYNLGNSYYRSGKLGDAILNYERALKIEPNDEDVKYNLRIVQARTVDKIQSVPKIFISEWWDVLVTMFPVSGWSVTLIIVYLLRVL